MSQTSYSLYNVSENMLLKAEGKIYICLMPPSTNDRNAMIMRKCQLLCKLLNEKSEKRDRRKAAQKKKKKMKIYSLLKREGK